MKTRVTITLDKDCLDVIDDYADVLGLSRSSVISGMLTESTPTLKKVTSEFRGFLEGMKGKLTEEEFFQLKGQMLRHVVDQLYVTFDNGNGEGEKR